MMKLGIIVKNTNGGVQDAFCFNKEDQWAKAAGDVRKYFKVLKNFDGTGKHVVMLKFLGPGLGYFLVLIKARSEGSGRPDDNTAAWIHVPSKMDISAEDMEHVLDNVLKAISGLMGSDEALLKQIAEIEFPEKDCSLNAVDRICSKDVEKFGAVYYGVGAEYARREVLGNSIANTVFNEVGAVFLIDKQSGILLENNAIEYKVQRFIKVSPPQPQNGFVPMMENKSNGKLESWNTPIELPYGQKIRVIWQKNGCKDIKRELSIKDNHSSGALEELYFTRDEIRYVLRKNQFVLIPADSTVQVNHKRFENGEMELSAEEMQHELNVVVSHDGYKSVEKKIAYPGNKTVSPISLTKEKVKYELYFADCRLTTYCETDSEDVEYPKGYKTHGPGPLIGGIRRVNLTPVDDFQILKKGAIAGAIAGFVLGLAIMFLIYFLFLSDSKVESPVERVPAVHQENAVRSAPETNKAAEEPEKNSAEDASNNENAKPGVKGDKIAKDKPGNGNKNDDRSKDGKEKKNAKPIEETHVKNNKTTKPIEEPHVKDKSKGKEQSKSGMDDV